MFDEHRASMDGTQPGPPKIRVVAARSAPRQAPGAPGAPAPAPPPAHAQLFTPPQLTHPGNADAAGSVHGSVAACSNVTTRASSSRTASLGSSDAPPDELLSTHRALVLASRLRALLERTSVGELLRAKRENERATCPDDDQQPGVLTLWPDTKIVDALRQLSRRRVLSAPVVDASSGELVHKGFLSLSDIVLDLCSRDTVELEALLRELGESTLGDGSHYPPGTEWQNLPVSEVMATPNWQDGHSVWRCDDPEYERLTVLELCREYFFHGSPDGPICHRVAVFRRDGDALRVAAVISAADIVRHSLLAATERPGPAEDQSIDEDSIAADEIAEDQSIDEDSIAADEIAALAARTTLAELGMAVKTVFTVDADDAALHAFQRMTRLGLTSAAAVSGFRPDGSFDGEVVCDVTAGDVRGVWPDGFRALTSPLREYIERVRGSERGAGENELGAVFWRPRPARPRFFRRSTTFAEAVERLSEDAVHHGFVSEDRAGTRVTSKDLIGIVTQTDVLRRICFEDEYLSECLSG